jgi:hypothetical protein
MVVPPDPTALSDDKHNDRQINTGGRCRLGLTSSSNGRPSMSQVYPQKQTFRGQRQGIRAVRSDNVAELAAVLEDTVYFTNRLFIPAAVVALIGGLAMVQLVWGFSLAWVWIGLIGYAVVVLSGTVLLKPRADSCVEFIRVGDSSELRARGRQIFCGSRTSTTPCYLLLLAIWY